MKRAYLTLSTALAALFGGVQMPAYDPMPSALNRPTSKRRKWRSGTVNVDHDTPRFARKMRKHGPEYHPGKLFKGHRI